AAYYPQPNRPGSITGANHFVQNSRPTVARDIVVARVDHQFNSSNQLMVRYFIAHEIDDNPGVFDVQADPTANGTNQTTHDGLANWTHTFRPDLLNEVRFGLNRRDYATYRHGLNENLAGKLGLTGVSDAGFPIVAITGFQGLGGAPSRTSSPLLDYQAQDAVSWF